MNQATDKEHLSWESPFTSKEWGLVVLAAIIAMGLRLCFSEFRGFWLDEYYTLNAVMLSVQELCTNRLAAGHSPLPFLYAKVFYHLFGDGEMALRSSSALMSGLAVIALGGIVSTLGLRRYLPTILVLAVFHPYWQLIGTELRYMMPLVAMAGFWYWSLLANARRPSVGLAITSAILGGVVLWIHGSAWMIYLSAVFFVALDLWRENSQRGKRAVLLGVPLLVSAALALPLMLLLAQQEKVAGDFNVGFPSIRLELMNQKETFFSDDKLWISVARFLPHRLPTVFFLVVHLGSILVLWIAARRGVFVESPKVVRFLQATLLGIPLAVMILTIFIKDVQGPDRYVAFQSLPMVLLLGLGIGYLSRVIKSRTIVKSLQLSVFLLIAVTWFFRAINEGEGHREAIHWIDQVQQGNESIIVCTMEMNMVALQYYGITDANVIGISPFWRETSDVKGAYDEGLATADKAYLLLYHDEKVPIFQALDEMREEGRLFDWVTWEVSRKVRVVGLAKTEEALKELKPLNAPERPWPTDHAWRKRSK